MRSPPPSGCARPRRRGRRGRARRPCRAAIASADADRRPAGTRSSRSPTSSSDLEEQTDHLAEDYVDGDRREGPARRTRSPTAEQPRSPRRRPRVADAARRARRGRRRRRTSGAGTNGLGPAVHRRRGVHRRPAARPAVAGSRSTAGTATTDELDQAVTDLDRGAGDPRGQAASRPPTTADAGRRRQAGDRGADRPSTPRPAPTPRPSSAS